MGVPGDPGDAGDGNTRRSRPRSPRGSGATPDTRAAAPGPTGYLLKCFPRISETFILNEVLELDRQGVELRIYSMNTPQDGVTHRLASGVRSPIAYLPFPLLPAAHRYARAHLGLLARRPWRYVRTLAAVLATRDRDLL